MRRANDIVDGIEVKIVRFGSDTTTVEVEENSTLEEVLAEANITLTASEVAWVNGEEAKSNDEMDDGDTIQLVGKKEGGLK